VLPRSSAADGFPSSGYAQCQRIKGGVAIAVKAADLESELIDSLCERVRKRLPDARRAPCESFIRQYYHWVPPEDLADRTPADLYGAALSMWGLAQERAPGEVAKLRSLTGN